MGTITRYRLMPVAFIAVNSLVRVSTPKVTSTATSTPKGRDVVDHAGGEVDEIFAYRDQRSAVADDVAQQLKEGKYQQQQNKTDQHQGKGGQKLAQHIIVENERKASPLVCVARSRLLRALLGLRSRVLLNLLTWRRIECRPSPDRHLPQQQQAEEGEEHVRRPYPEQRPGPCLRERAILPVKERK